MFSPIAKEAFRLSRSKIDLFTECPRCFYLDRRLGVSRPPGFPFNLNSAVDHLLKKEFDIHREHKTSHPLMDTYGIDAVPFQHKDIDKWRKNFVGVQFLHKPTNFLITGAIDDVWVNKKGELMIVDYKATSKDSEINLDAAWQDGYKRQMEVYQWLMRQNGFEVSSTGYFVYANGRRDKESFDGKLEFDVTIIPYKGSDSWIPKTLEKIKLCLVSEIIPVGSETCDYCNYVASLNETVTAAIPKNEKTIKKRAKQSNQQNGADSNMSLL